MKRTDVYVEVEDNGESVVRRLHVDSQGRDVVRLNKRWERVRRTKSAFGTKYVVEGGQGD